MGEKKAKGKGKFTVAKRGPGVFWFPRLQLGNWVLEGIDRELPPCVGAMVALETTLTSTAQ